MPPPVLLAVDGNSLVHRSYHAQARSEQPSWAVRGLLTQLVAAVERVRPAAVVVGFDDPARSDRRERWPQYKAQRGEKLDSLVDQLVEAQQVLHDLGVAVVVPAGLEADDVLASCAAYAPRHGARTVVVTSDRDAFALIGEHTHVLRIINGGVDASPTMTPDRLVLLLGVRPEQYRDYAALRGDASDNLPGVRGVGARTAARLLEVFGTARAAFDDPQAVREALGAGVARRLSAEGARDAWELNCQVMAMRDDVPLGLELSGGTGVLPLHPTAVERVFRRLNLTWTAATAARVLADAEAPTAAPPAHVETMRDDRYFGNRSKGSQRLPRLAPKAPTAEQLSLF